MRTRRQFLRALGQTVGAATLLPSKVRIGAPASDAARHHLRGVGIQLYMLRGAMRADLGGSLARVARLGYEEVEWWGTWGRTPAQMRAMLDGLGLRAPTAHVGSAALEPAQLDATLDAAATMGHSTVIVAGMDRGYADSAEGWIRAAALLSAAGAKAAPLGLRVGYHNHDREFRRHGAQSALEILIARSDPATVDLQLDCYWAFKGGQDPLAFLRAHAGRIAHLHLKDAAPTAPYAQVDLGQGVIDWRTIIATGVSQRVTNITLDLDDPADAWTSAGSARSYLRGLGY